MSVRRKETSTWHQQPRKEGIKVVQVILCLLCTFTKETSFKGLPRFSSPAGTSVVLTLP